jgi:Tfp pilus assembly PilM family ATPase
VNGFALFNGAGAYLELRHGTLEVVEGARGLELPLTRGAGGRLTDDCKQAVVAKLQEFFKRPAWQPRLRVLCAMGARGVSLRRLSLPATTREDFQRVLQLQIETEFPLPPDELAWGYRVMGEKGGGGPNARQEILVAAIKREVVEEYEGLLGQCGVTPVFTLAALARSRLCPQPPPAYAVLDIGQYNSELAYFSDGVPTSLRIVPWGGETITRALAERLHLQGTEAEIFKLKLETEVPPNGEVGPKVESALEAVVEALAGTLRGQSEIRMLYLTGKSIRQKDLAARLARRLGQGVECQAVEVTGGAGRTAAVLGMQQLTLAGEAPLLIQAKPGNGRAVVARPAPWKWVGIAAGLAAVLLLLPYGQALLFKGHLARKLAAVKKDSGRLAVIDRELNFLEYLKQSQPPYLDTLYLFAKAAPPGARIDSLTMNRRGELTWRGTLKDAQQVADFRSKLIDSGMFANVSVEEQAPSQDRQKLSVRMSAQWKPISPRQMLALGPTAEEIEKARTNVHQQMPGPAMFPGGFPGMEGPPPGGPMPMPVRRTSRPTPTSGMPPGMQVTPGSPMPGAPGAPNLPPGVNPPPGQNP